MNELKELALFHQRQALLYETLADGLSVPRSRAVLLGFAEEDRRGSALLREADYLQNGHMRLPQNAPVPDLPAIPCEELLKRCILEEATLARRYAFLADGCTDAYLRALFVRLAQTARARVARLPVLIADLPASE
ncbi:MAG: hypothetical protein IKD06_03745 [Clostridia bacterium]|nr:hypothetical protein [Clostridia bacterium]